jgi:hypothetical protein
VHDDEASGTACPLLTSVSAESDPIAPGLQHEAEAVPVEPQLTNGAASGVEDGDEHSALFVPRTSASGDVCGAAHHDDAADELSRRRKSRADDSGETVRMVL